jgi:SMI1 / KNR4 family (SUKH-1)
MLKKSLSSMQRFEEILTKYHVGKRTAKLKMTFEEVEKIIDFKLPEDYKAFALNYLEFEGFIEKQYLRLWDFEEIIKINTDYQIFEYLPNTIGIGTNGGGEFVAIEQVSDNSFRIVLSPFITEKEAHIELGSSFTDFLQHLENGKEWFA